MGLPRGQSTDNLGRYLLTDRGHQLVETKSRELVLGYLLCECERMYDVLATVRRLGTATGESVWDELRFEHQSPNGKQPESDYYRFRLDWLASLGALAKDDQRFSVTNVGIQALAEYAGKQPIPNGSTQR
jgi:hypothetical protein